MRHAGRSTLHDSHTSLSLLCATMPAVNHALKHSFSLQYPLRNPWLMQGHALFARHAGSKLPCPYVDYEAGFNGILAGAYGLAPGETIEKLFGKQWDPYVNDATYTISMLTLEELGATGNKVCICTVPAILPVHAYSASCFTCACNVPRPVFPAATSPVRAYGVSYFTCACHVPRPVFSA